MSPVTKGSEVAEAEAGSPSESFPEAGKRVYRPEIDGLRALAVIAVLINHLNKGFLPGGYLGVDIFFVISGYVVTSSLIHRNDRNWREYLKRFYQRRFRRLMPALILNVFLVSLIFSAFASPLDDIRLPSLRTGLTSLFGVSNLYLLRQGTDYFATSTLYNPFTHTWSLGVEEQFYLVWPILLMLCGVGLAGSRFVRSRLTGLCLALMTASLIFYLHLSTGGQQDAAFFLMPARFWELSIGCLAFLSHERLSIHPGVVNRWRGGTPGAVLLVVIVALLFTPEASRMTATLGTVLLTSILLVVIDPEHLPGRVLSQPAILFIGLSSYSLYLWHWPVIVLARWTIGLTSLTLLPILVAILILTVVSYRFETFFRNHRFREGLQAKPLILYPLAALLTAILSLLIQGPGKWAVFLGNRGNNMVDTSNMKRIAGTSINTINCFREPIAPLEQNSTFPTCLSSQDDQRPTLYFEGDSHTHAIMPLGEMILRQGDFNVSFFARGGCPFPSFSPMVGDRDTLPRYRLCAPHAQQRLDELLPRLKAGDALVLVSMIAENFNSARNPSASESRKNYVKTINSLAAALETRRANLILFAPLPVFPDRPRIMAPLSICTPEWFRPSQPVSAACAPATIARSEHLRKVAAMREILQRLQRKNPNVHVYDPLDQICPATTPICSTHHNDTMLFSDSNHITNTAARSLYPSFRNFLKTMPRS